MRKLLLVLAVSLSLFACGKQGEKSESPFGKSGKKSTDPKMTETEFKKDCLETKHGYFVSNNTICYYVPYKFTLDADLKKELEDKGSLNYLLGAVTQGALLWGDVKGGQRVNFDLNGTLYTNMSNAPLAKTPLNAGRLTIRIEAGNYEFINAYVAQCFTRDGSVACPPN